MVYRDGLRARRRSAIQLITEPDVNQLRWSRV